MESRFFFSFRSKFLLSTVQAYPLELKEDENGMHAHHNLIKGKYEGIEFPVIFRQDSGKNLADMLDTGHVGLYLISDRMKSILEENNLTGWKVFPIKLYDKKDNEIQGYNGFSVTGQCDSVHYKKSEIFEKKLVSDGPIRRYYKGLFINQWDGLDFFTPKETYRIFVTKRAADILKRHKITNIELESLIDYEGSVNNMKSEPL